MPWATRAAPDAHALSSACQSPLLSRSLGWFWGVCSSVVATWADCMQPQTQCELESARPTTLPMPIAREAASDVPSGGVEGFVTVVVSSSVSVSDTEGGRSSARQLWPAALCRCSQQQQQGVEGQLEL